MDEMLLVEYVCKDGVTRSLNIAYEATSVFGFVYQQRVTTPLGPGTVLGVCGGTLYFQLDSDSGASHWLDCNSALDFKNKGVTALHDNRNTSAGPSSSLSGVDSEYHTLKSVIINGVKRCIVMQSVNGPCPIIALANALILSGALTNMVPQGTTVITAASLRRQLFDYLSVPHVAPKCTGPHRRGDQVTLAGLIAEQLEEVRAQIISSQPPDNVLIRYYGGLDVAPYFTHIDAFDGQPTTALFALAGIRLVHGWIFGDQNCFAPLRMLSYDEIQNKACDSDSEDGQLAHALLQERRQLTQEGLFALVDGLDEGEVCVQFFNDHFSTIMKRGGSILRLVSDTSYTSHSCIVFERILDINGTIEYVDGDGEPVDEVVLGVQCKFGDKYSPEEIMVLQAEIYSEVNWPATAEDVIRRLEARERAAAAVKASSTPAKNPLMIANTSFQNSPPPAVLTLSGTASPGDVSSQISSLMAMGLCDNETSARSALTRYGSLQAAIDGLLNEI